MTRLETVKARMAAMWAVEKNHDEVRAQAAEAGRDREREKRLAAEKKYYDLAIDAADEMNKLERKVASREQEVRDLTRTIAALAKESPANAPAEPVQPVSAAPAPPVAKSKKPARPPVSPALRASIQNLMRRDPPDPASVEREEASEW